MSAYECAEQTCRRRDDIYGSQAMTPAGVGPNGRNLIEKAGPGRRPLFCSSGCKQAAYRRRAAEAELIEQRRARDHAQLGREHQAELVARRVLADHVSAQRGAGQKRFTQSVADTVAVELVRSLVMAGLLS